MFSLYKNTSRVKRVFGVGASALLATTLFSCGGSSPSPTSQYGGSIEVGIFDTFPGFCVSNNPANSALMATRSVYETLFERSEDGEMIGLLAKSATPSDDRLTWTVLLRTGISFHDGEPFNAAAVVSNFNAITGRVAAAAYAAGGLAGLGSQAFTIGTGTAFTANILSFEAIDDSTIEFKLDRPQNDFTATLYASGRFFMRSPKQLQDQDTCATTAIGTGPFVLKSWTTSSMTVLRNPNYWRINPANGEKLPYLDQINFLNVKETGQRASSVQTGTLAAAMFSSASEALTIKDLRGRTSDVNEFRSATEYYPSLWLNQGKPGSPFEELSARQAVLSCLDRDNYLKVRLSNEGEVATSIVGKDSIMYSTKSFPKFDVVAARNYVLAYKEATGKSSLSFMFPSDTSGNSQANARFLKDMWAKCDIDANFVIEETAVLIGKALNASPDIESGQYYNAYDLIPLLLFEGNDVSFNLPFIVTNAYSAASRNPVKALFQNNVGAVLGLTHHADTKVDELFYQGQAAANDADAKNIYSEGAAYLQENAFIGSLANIYYSVFASPKLQGIGDLALDDSKTQRVVSNWGIDWTGVYLQS